MKQGIWSRLWESVFGERERICGKCLHPILKTHRWHVVRRRVLGRLYEKDEHQNCARPTESRPMRAICGWKGSPFADGEAVFSLPEKWPWETPAQEIARLD
jgi:hypothetical protein